MTSNDNRKAFDGRKWETQILHVFKEKPENLKIKAEFCSESYLMQTMHYSEILQLPGFDELTFMNKTGSC